MIPIVPLVGGDRREPSLEDATPQGGLYQHLLLRQCMALPPTKGGTRGPPPLWRGIGAIQTLELLGINMIS